MAAYRHDHEETEGFKGQFTSLRLSDLIQMSAQGRMNLILHINQIPDKTGKIYIHDGEIIHAIAQEKQGIEAFYEIMSWKKGEFKAEDFVPPPSQSINLPWEHLLIEAHRWLDEQKEKFTNKEEENLPFDASQERLTELLAAWGNSLPDILEIGIFSNEEVRALFQKEEKCITQKGLEILRTSTRLSEILSNKLTFGSCHEITVTGSEGTALLFTLHPTLQLYILLRVNISQKAILRMEISSLVKKVKEELSPSTPTL